MTMRTAKGNVTATARKKTGIKGKKFPVFDEKSARSALKLRNHGKGVSPSSVLNKVSRWAKAHGKTAILKAVQKAKKKGK